MLYQLNYEANVCLVPFVQSRQSLVHALSTELWSKCLPSLLRPIETISGECYINWTMKQMSALPPSSNQDSLWWMLYQLNYKSNVWLVSFLQSRQSLVNALTTELWSKCLPCLQPSSHQDSLRSMLYQLNYEANVCLVSFVQSRQSLVNALSTELWSKCLPCFRRPIKTFSGTCSINWTMKQMYALSPSCNQDSLWYMLYQQDYESNVRLVSFL